MLIRLLYDIGFVGLSAIADSDPQYRSAGPQSSTPPPIGDKALITIHPTYADALNLQNMIVSSLSEEVDLKQSGFIGELPGSIDIATYTKQIELLRENLKTLPHGDAKASEFEDLVGDIIRLCFFTALTNVEAKVRNVDGRVIRDWIAGNHSSSGFWELVRQKYGATQVIWECKNYGELRADDFHQAAYYMTEAIGRFVVVAYRGREKKKFYFEHIRRIATDKTGIVLLLDERDLDVFFAPCTQRQIQPITSAGAVRFNRSADFVAAIRFRGRFSRADSRQSTPGGLAYLLSFRDAWLPSQAGSILAVVPWIHLPLRLPTGDSLEDPTLTPAGAMVP